MKLKLEHDIHDVTFKKIKDHLWWVENVAAVPLGFYPQFNLQLSLNPNMQFPCDKVYVNIILKILIETTHQVTYMTTPTP